MMADRPPEIERLLSAVRDARRRGGNREAEGICRRVVATWPDVAEAVGALGLLLHAEGRKEAAARPLGWAAYLEPDNPSHPNNLGMLLRELERYDEAEAACREALRRRWDFAKAWLNLGNVHFARGDHGLAGAHYREAIRLDGGYGKAWLNLARVQWHLKDHEGTRRSARMALRLAPSGRAWYLLASAEMECRHHGEALTAVENALSDESVKPEALSLKAGILRDLSRYDEALAIQRTRVGEHPDDPDAWNDLGMTLDHMNRLDEAEGAYETAIRLLEDEGASHAAAETGKLHKVRLNRTFTLLKKGDFDRGWAEYACRWDCREKDIRKTFTMPVWRGEPLSGKHLIVVTEQGLGDTVQFARYLDILRDHDPPGRLTLAATTALAPLFSEYPWIDRVLGDGEKIPPADFHCMLMDLPSHFGTRLDDIPAQTPYIPVSPERARSWRERVRAIAGAGFTVGVAWQGNPKLAHDHHRSFPLDALAPLFAVPGVTWVRLQKDAGTEQSADGRHPVLDVTGGDDRRDLMDTAALMGALDLIIAPDSMPAHLAGAVGRPVWVPLAARGEWRWLTEREDSPWYPTMRLFRQTIPGRWDDVMERMAAALARAVAESSPVRLDIDACRSALASGRPDRAAAIARELVDAPDTDAGSQAFLAEILRRGGDLPMAERAARRAVASPKPSPTAYNNLGLVLLERGDGPTARTCLRIAACLDPVHLQAIHNGAKLRLEEGRLGEADAFLDRALRLSPVNAFAWTAKGSIARRRYDLPAAAAHFRRALDHDPDFLRAHLGLASVMAERGAWGEARSELERLAARSPDRAEIWAELGAVLDRGREGAASAAAYAKAVTLRPADEPTRLALLDARRKCCDWTGWSAEIARMEEATRRSLAAGDTPAIPALTSLRYPTSGTLQRRIAEAHARRIAAQAAARRKPVRGAGSGDGRLRIGFLTHEFRKNVVGHFLRHLPAAFDRDRFEIFGFDYGPGDGSDIRRDLIAGCDAFEDLRTLPITEAAGTIARRGIDILIDVNAYMREGRPEIAAMRPAPIQVSYLYPGAMGAPWIDHVLTDEIVTPPEHRAFYSENLLFLPPCYLPATGRVPIAPDCPDRAHYGLPRDAFVFCSFNSEDKCDPECFDAWMRVLGGVPGSVLWMNAGPGARPHLRLTARASGIDPARLIFSEHEADMSVHMARHRHAELFLDSFIHNAHVTAADALWAGLPLLTRKGDTYAGRVAASLLTAAEMPELIAEDTDDFVRRAIRFARAPDDLKALRAAWAERRPTHRLFDAKAMASALGRVFEEVASKGG